MLKKQKMLKHNVKSVLVIIILTLAMLLFMPKASIGTSLNAVGETTVTRVEEQEKLVSKEYWDWWTPLNNVATATLTNMNIEETQLEVNKTVTTETGSNNLVYAGEEVTYEINITNKGTRTEENIEVIDQIPQNTTFVSVNDENTAEEMVDENNNVIGIKWYVTVEPEETVTVSFTVKVKENVEGTITNTGLVNGKESNETHTAIIKNEKTSRIIRNGEEVKIAKVGDQIIYTITAINTGDVAGAISIQDTIPEGTTLVSAEGATISENNKTLTWDNVNVPAGGRVSVQFTVEVEEIDGEITNIATVGGKETEENRVPTAEIEVIKEVADITRDGTSIGANGEVTENVAEAETYLKLVRERSFPAGQANTDQFIADCGSLLNAVIQERGFEFAGEGDRRFTLVRTGMLPDAIRNIKEMTRAMLDDLAAQGYHEFENGNVISNYVWTKLVDARTEYGYRLTTECPADKKDDPVLYPGWRGQNDAWENYGCDYGTNTPATNLAIKGLFEYIDPNGAEAKALEADGYEKQDWGAALVANDAEYYQYLFYDYDYVSAPIHLWPFTPNTLATGGFTNGYGFAQQ